MAAKFSRRTILIGVGAAAASLLAACGAPAAPTPAPAKPTEAPKAAAPAAAPTTAPAAAPTAAPAAPKPTEAPKPTAATQPAASKAIAGTVRWQNRGADYEIKASQEWFAGDFKKQFPNINLTIEPAPDGRDEKLITAMGVLQGQMTTNITSFTYAAIRTAILEGAGEVEQMRRIEAGLALGDALVGDIAQAAGRVELRQYLPQPPDA